MSDTVGNLIDFDDVWRALNGAIAIPNRSRVAPVGDYIAREEMEDYIKVIVRGRGTS